MCVCGVCVCVCACVLYICLSEKKLRSVAFDFGWAISMYISAFYVIVEIISHFLHRFISHMCI